MFNSEMEQMQHEYNNYENASRLGEDIELLMAYPPFQRVVLESYCVGSVVENVASSINLNLDNELRNLCTEMSRAPALFQQWLNAKQQIARVSKANMAKLKEDMLEDTKYDSYEEGLE